MNWLYKISQTLPTKSDIVSIRPVLRSWISGGYDDRDRLLRLLTKHQDILNKFRPTSPLRVWRNERIESSVGHNAGWENQYDYPTAWSMNKHDAEGYASGLGRRLVTAIAQPNDVFCSIPLVEYYIRQLGLKSIDVHSQNEVIIKPRPSFLDNIRPPPKISDVSALKSELEKLLLQYYLPQLKSSDGPSESHMRYTIKNYVDMVHEYDLYDKIRDIQTRLI